MEQKKIIILDFATAVVHVFTFDENIYSSGAIVDFFDAMNEEGDYGLKESQCEWMIVQELKLEIH